VEDENQCIESSPYWGTDLGKACWAVVLRRPLYSGILDNCNNYLEIITFRVLNTRRNAGIA
jgi:hypothetical protein